MFTSGKSVAWSDIAEEDAQIEAAARVAKIALLVVTVVEVEAAMVSSILYAKSQTRQVEYQVNAAADFTARAMDVKTDKYIRCCAHC